MIRHLLISAAIAVAVSACAATPPKQPVSAQNNALTHGNVQMQVQVGQTTQADILETFGAPNVTTIDGSGQEVWSYQRAATVQQSSSNDDYWTVLFAGAGVESSGFEQSSRMTTLIIKFDGQDIVSDFRSRSSNF